MRLSSSLASEAPRSKGARMAAGISWVVPVIRGRPSRRWAEQHRQPLLVTPFTSEAAPAAADNRGGLFKTRLRFAFAKTRIRQQ